jgi:hypothetical protein
LSSDQNLAGKPVQRWLIRDYQVRGAASSTSEGGARLGLTVPSADNFGGLEPVVLGDPTDSTDDEVSVALSRGGSIGTGQWIWSDSAGTVYGAHSELYRWGHHSPTATQNQGAAICYSSVFRRIIVATVDNSFSPAKIRISYVDRNARPQSSSDWTTTTFTPTNGDYGQNHSLAICELRDGTLLLLARRTDGDFDFYRSSDGGVTWQLALEALLVKMLSRLPGASTTVHQVADLHDHIVPRIASAGDWVRLVLGASSGGLVTYISSDNGASWAYSDTLDTVSDLETALDTVQGNDVQPYALVGLDASTGAFGLVANPNASGDSSKVHLWYASRDDTWDGKSVFSNPTIDATPRSYLAWVDPYWLYVWVYAGDNNTPNDGWYSFRAQRDRVLDSASWQGRGELNPTSDTTDTLEQRDKTFGASRLIPIQASAVWCDDHAAVSTYLQDQEETPPVTRKASRPMLFRVGGWSARPWSTDYIANNGFGSALYWSAEQGDPAGEATSSGDSRWTTTISGGGTHSWANAGWVETSSSASANGTAYLELKYASGATGEAKGWTNPNGQIWAAEFVAAVGNTAVSTPLTPIVSAGARFEVPDQVGGGGYGWRVIVALGTTRVTVSGTSVLATISGLDLTTAEDPRFHRFRLVVAPATSPSQPTGILQYRRDDGDAWQETATFSMGLSTSLGITQHGHRFGVLGFALSPIDNYVSRWREFRVSSANFETDYTNLDTTRFPGALVAGRPRGLSAGSTSTDPSRLRVAWGGAGGIYGDAWTHTLDHDYPASALGLDSPQLAWRSAAGATAGTQVVLDACGAGATVDDGSRWTHSGLALFGLENPNVTVTYADDSAGTVNAVSSTLSTVQYTGIRVTTRSGRMIRISKPTGSWRDGDLSGRLVQITAGGGLGQVHKIERHLVGDDGVDRLELAVGSQFTGSAISAGDSVTIFASRGWLSYGSTLTPRRYMILSFGAAGENNWAGYWTCGSVVPGIERTWSPPLLWTHTDEANPFLTVQRARGGQSWAYRDSDPERTWTGRMQGAVAGERQAFRDAMNYIARSGEEPCALLLDAEHDADEDRAILLARYQGSISLDNQAYARAAGASSQAWAVGDMAVSFTELT